MKILYRKFLSTLFAIMMCYSVLTGNLATTVRAAIKVVTKAATKAATKVAIKVAIKVATKVAILATTIKKVVLQA